MKSIIIFFFSLVLFGKEPLAADKPPTIYLQPNTTQLFTELYQAYNLLMPIQRTFFEEALYLDQSIPPTFIPLQLSNQAIFDHASEVLSQFHRQVNDLELYIDPDKPKPFFYTALGSKQLIVALVYAIVTSEPNKKFLFVEQAPFYSGHPNAVTGIFNYPNARFLAFHDPSEISLSPGEVLVEFVTSPNNPDGKFRKPLTNAQIIIADFVFASSAFGNDGQGYLDKNIAWIKEARSQGKHIFSFNSASKQFGKTGTRCGYIWYPIYDSYAISIFNKFFKFISSSTVAGSSTGLAEFLNLIKAFLDLPDTGKSLRDDAKKSLIRRHELIEKEILTRYPGTSIISIPGSPTLFAKIKDARIPNKKASDVLFEDVGVVVNDGEAMGETNAYVRLNLCGYSRLLVEFLNRLANQTKYKVDDVLFASTSQCSQRLISTNESGKVTYHMNPGDCIIEADALKNDIDIVAPAFIDYDASQVITIIKTDPSNHAVTIRTDHFTKALKNQGERLHIQWTQPFYLNGQWHVVENP